MLLTMPPIFSRSGLSTSLRQTTAKNLGVIMDSMKKPVLVCVWGILQHETAAIFRVTGFIALHTGNRGPYATNQKK